VWDEETYAALCFTLLHQLRVPTKCSHGRVQDVLGPFIYRTGDATISLADYTLDHWILTGHVRVLWTSSL